MGRQTARALGVYNRAVLNPNFGFDAAFTAGCLPVVLALLAGCSLSTGRDAGLVDTGGFQDTGADAGSDAGAPDLGDSGADDAGPSDAGVGDAAPGDGSEEDAAADVGMDAGSPDSAPSAWNLVVSVGQEQRLAVIDVEADGTMAELTDDSISVPGNPGALTYDPATQRFYVGLSGANAGFATVQYSAGQLSVLGRTPSDIPTYLVVARPGRLVAPYYGQAVVRSFDISIDAPHTLLDEEASTTNPHASLLGPAGLVYVPHTGGNEIRWYSVMPDGQLVLQGQVRPPAGDEPRHIIFHPQRDFAYVVNERTLSVGSYAVAANGDLSLLATESALPAGVPANGSGADIHISADGRFVYSSNRGHNSIARFSVEADGTLSFIDATATEAIPREFDITPDGRLLIVLGQGSGRLASYLLGAQGELLPVQTLNVGPDLRWAIPLAR